MHSTQINLPVGRQQYGHASVDAGWDCKRREPSFDPYLPPPFCDMFSMFSVPFDRSGELSWLATRRHTTIGTSKLQ